MSCIGNLLWILFGGLIISIEYLIAGILLCITIIGIPFGFQSFKLAILALWPFGQVVITKPATGGCLNLFFNLLWLFIGGIWIALTHLIFGIILCLTLIGIPFGMQHFKMANLALTPFGKEIVPE